jgi:hypothetical protein
MCYDDKLVVTIENYPYDECMEFCQGAKGVKYYRDGGGSKLCVCSDPDGLVGEAFLVESEEECVRESREDWICEVWGEADFDVV